MGGIRVAVDMGEEPTTVPMGSQTNASIVGHRPNDIEIPLTLRLFRVIFAYT